MNSCNSCPRLARAKISLCAPRVGRAHAAAQSYHPRKRRSDTRSREEPLAFDQSTRWRFSGQDLTTFSMREARVTCRALLSRGSPAQRWKFQGRRTCRAEVPPLRDEGRSTLNAQLPTINCLDLLVHYLDLLVDHLPGQPIDRYINPVMLFVLIEIPVKQHGAARRATDQTIPCSHTICVRRESLRR